MQHFQPDFRFLEDVEVETPNKEDILKEAGDIDRQLKEAKTKEEAILAVRRYFAFIDDIHSMASLIYIRHTIDTRDKKYDSLSDLLNEISPEIDEAVNRIESDIYDSPFQKDLKEEFHDLFFRQIALSRKTFSPEIIPDLVEENKLGTEYMNLISSALIDYKGEKLSISQMGKYTTSLDRETRKEASALVWKFYSDNDEKIGDIYSRMIAVRTRIAKKLGYEDFVQLGYDRMGRLDWNQNDAEEYRKKILDYIVPLSESIKKAQRERVGLGKEHRYFDDVIFYQSGNPKPKGDTKHLVDAAMKMYDELSPVASKYFRFMVDHHCFDLDAKPGKAGGGYMDYIPGLKTSFIFSNSNGTSQDVDTLTHEFGHALQGFLGGTNEVPGYRMPGMECCEMHSMSMEFLTYPWMEYFFKEDTDKYLYQHLADAITFIPYGAIVDAFQTYCYKHPDMTHQERKAYFRSLEKSYLPSKDYTGNEFLESGGYWMRQHHIFENPLYYLDYTIAQVVALEFFRESRIDRNKALEKYLAFDRLAGTYPFRELLKKAGIGNPLDGDTLKEVSEDAMKYLSSFDLSKIDR